MARNLTVKVTGMPEERGISANTIGEIRDRYGAGKHNASVDGSPASDSQELMDGQFVAFAPAVKGN